MMVIPRKSCSRKSNGTAFFRLSVRITVAVGHSQRRNRMRPLLFDITPLPPDPKRDGSLAEFAELAVGTRGGIL